MEVSRLYYIVCYIFLLAGLTLALVSLAYRVRADEKYKDVIVLLDWEGLRSLPTVKESQELSSGAIDNAAWELFDSIPGAKLCYGEETVGSLLEQGIITTAWLHSGSPAYQVSQYRFNDDIAKGLLRHGYRYERSPETGGRLVFALPALPEEELMLLPIAWLSEVQRAAEQRGIECVLRPGGGEFFSDTGLHETLLFARDAVPLVFQGPSVLGFPAGTADTAAQMKKYGVTFGWIEFDEQDGGAELARRLAPNVVRVHSIPAEEMVNYDVDGAVDRLIRATEERSIRCLYVRPFIRGKVIDTSQDEAPYGEGLLSSNHQFLGNLKYQLDERGYRIAAAVNPPAGKPGWLKLPLQLSFVLAKGGAFLLLLALWFPAWPRWAWHALMALVVGKALLSLVVPQLNLFFLVETAVVFPLLGVWLALLVYLRLTARLNCAALCVRRMFLALLGLLIASTVSFAGGMLIHSVMWDTNAILKIEQFRGVTLALALPLLFLAGYSWHAETLSSAYDRTTQRLSGYWPRMLALWNAPIRYGDVAFIVIVLGAVAVVLLRSGNESPLEVLSVESWFRGGLEDYFGLRPRTKELLGHPFFMLFLLTLAWRMRAAILFGLAGVLAQASIVNTFQHLHTPLMMTIERTLLGLALGALTGLIWCSIALVVYWLWTSLSRRLNSISEENLPGAGSRIAEYQDL